MRMKNCCLQCGETLTHLGIQTHTADELAQQDISGRPEKTQQASDADDQSPWRRRFPVWLDGWIQYLNDGCGFRLVESGGLILLRQQLEHGFGILHVAQFPDIL